MSEENADLIRAMGDDPAMKQLRTDFLRETSKWKYTYHFSWLGVPIIQAPQDIVAIQELVWEVKPDLIIETGVAHGGSLVLSASMLELLGGDRQVVGIDIDIRPHNRQAIEAHPLASHIILIEGSSIDEAVIEQVREIASTRRRVMVMLDSNHTHEHVREELDLYSPLVKSGSYLVVYDTAIEDMPEDFFPNRPWSKDRNPASAVREFLAVNDRFLLAKEIESKLVITVAPGGYLRCVKD